jgi:hypothetical protein
VVCFELTPEIKVATRTDVEVVFVGYFLKDLKYDTARGMHTAPVLIGRVKAVPGGAPRAPVGGQSDPPPPAPAQSGAANKGEDVGEDEHGATLS